MTMRKLIPCNLVMALLCLVSILSLLFFPILTVDMAKLAGAMADGQTEEAEIPDMEISITTVGLGKIATSKNKGAELLTEYFFHEGGGVEKAFLRGFTRGLLSAVDSEKFGNVDVEKLNNILFKLEDENVDPDAVSAEYAATLNEELARVGAETVDADEVSSGIRDYYDDVTEHTGGKFSMEALICLAVTGFAEDSPTDYKTLVEKLAAGETFSGGEENSILASLSGMISTISSYANYISYAFYAMLVLLLPWALFFLLAVLHILLRNKRAATWYLFVFGWLPCVLFWALPKLAGLILPTVMGEGGGAIVSMLAAIGSYAWISGICLVVMWLLWLVWMRPLKKRAKRESY